MSYSPRDGLFQVDVKRLNIVNSIDNLIVATRHTNTAVRKGDKLAGVRVVPLVIEEKTIKQAERFIPKSTLLSLSPWKRKTCGLIITGSEVAQGLVRDAFAPALEEKLSGYGMRIAERCFPGDDQQAIAKAAVSYWKKGLDMVICTGGMSVDPDDRTPLAIKNTGARIVSYGAPVLPGAMFLLSYYQERIPIVGLPGCVMYAKRTVFDLVLPRLIANDPITADELAMLGEGGLCLNCPQCTFPNCGFGKGW